MSREHRRPPKRASRRAVRTWAWTAGALSFLSPWALLGLSPKPATAAGASVTAATTAPARPRRPVVVVVTKRIVITDSPTSSVSTSGSGPVQYVYAPAAPATASTCGSHAC